jgi:hypothetical protein
VKQLLLALALIVVGCHVQPAPAGPIDVSGLPRVYKVAEGIFRGPQPTAEQFVALRDQLGIKSDIKLNTAWPLDGGHDVLPAGVMEFHHPWPPFGPVSHEMILDTMEDLADAPRPVYYHCLHGEDRTGLLTGLHRVFNEHAPVCAAWGEMRAYGFHDGVANRPELVGLVETFNRETGGCAE